MQREIIFRGLRKDGGGWAYGYLVELINTYWIIPVNQTFRSPSDADIENSFVMVIRETVGQYTGLKDKNGNKIFEGDFDQNHDVVMWCNKSVGWTLNTYDFPTDTHIHCHCYQCLGHFDITDDLSKIEIIGNIHEK